MSGEHVRLKREHAEMKARVAACEPPKPKPSPKTTRACMPFLASVRPSVRACVCPSQACSFVSLSMCTCPCVHVHVLPMCIPHACTHMQHVSHRVDTPAHASQCTSVLTAQVQADPTCGTPVECYAQATKLLDRAEQQIAPLKIAVAEVNKTVTVTNQLFFQSLRNVQRDVSSNANNIANLTKQVEQQNARTGGRTHARTHARTYSCMDARTHVHMCTCTCTHARAHGACACVHSRTHMHSR